MATLITPPPVKKLTLTTTEAADLLDLTGGCLRSRINSGKNGKSWYGSYEHFPPHVEGSYPYLYETAAVLAFIATLPEPEQTSVQKTPRRLPEPKSTCFEYSGRKLVILLFLQAALLAKQGGCYVL